MESLYRTYRPQTFADVVGQQHVVGTLERAVLEGRTSHAYLFCGPRGTGKTTMARLLAKALMCEQGAGHLPDGTCEQCQLIASGEHPDVYELDAASRTGVDNVREEIINRVGYAPVRGRYKVYIIDEVHMLTTAAFNALLKTLEEPPSHIVFVLCTTDPQKIPATILSRVQRFDFRPISNDDILARLVHVCEQEGFTYEDAALELVVRHARGGMRDALSTLEQLSVFGGGVIELAAAQDMLGAVPGAALGEVVTAMADRDVPALFSHVGALVDAGRDLLQFTRELAAHMRDVYVVAAVGANPSILPAASDVAQLQAEAARFGSTDRLARILTSLGDVSRQMSTAPNQRLVLEIAFTRIARPQSDLTLESLAERIAELERNGVPASPAVVAPSAVAAPQVSGPAPTQVEPQQEREAASSSAPQAPEPVAPPAPEPVTAPAPVAPPAPVAAPRPTAPRPAAPQVQAPPRQPTPPRHSAPTQAQRPQEPMQSAPEPAQPAPQPVRDAGALQRQWRQVVSELVARIPARGSLLASAVATSDDGTTLVVSLPKGSVFALKMLERPDIRASVEQMVNEVFGHRALVFKEGIGTTPAPSPSARPRASAAPQRPAPQPAPQPAPEPVSQPAAHAYPMPWDEPAAVPETALPDEPVPYEQVPYEEYGFQDDTYVPDPAPVPEPQPEPAPAPVPDPEPEPVEAPVLPDVSDDLPPDLAAVLANAFEVFGEDVLVKK